LAVERFLAMYLVNSSPYGPDGLKAVVLGGQCALVGVEFIAVGKRLHGQYLRLFAVRVFGVG